MCIYFNIYTKITHGFEPADTARVVFLFFQRGYLHLVQT